MTIGEGGRGGFGLGEEHVTWGGVRERLVGEEPVCGTWDVPAAHPMTTLPDPAENPPAPPGQGLVKYWSNSGQTAIPHPLPLSRLNAHLRRVPLVKACHWSKRVPLVNASRSACHRYNPGEILK